jgi:hypothetical protein
MIFDLRKVENKYKVYKDKAKDLVSEEKEKQLFKYELRGKYGEIYPYGYDESLAVYVNSPKIVSIIKKRFNLEILQKGDYETVFKFYSDLLEKIADLIKAKKKRVISNEFKSKLLQRLARSSK